jgi:hypothetical protein
MSLPKWTEERTNALIEAVSGVSTVSQELVASIAEKLDTTSRSISSKLRKLGYEVELSSASKVKKFTDTEATALADFVENNSGRYTYSEVAEQFEEGKFTAKEIQGKILSMELTGCIKPTPKPESTKTYTDEEEAIFIDMALGGAFLEDIAAKLGRELNPIRGKALSLLRMEAINAIPVQRESKATVKTDALEELGDVSTLTVEQIAEKIGKTPRGVRTMLTHRGIKVADYDGAAKKAKIKEA